MATRLMMACALLTLMGMLAVAQQPDNNDLMQAIQALREDLTNRVKANETSIADLKRELDDLKTEMRDSIERQRQIVDAISHEDSAGRRVPTITSIMQESPEFRQEVFRAVHDSLQKEGTVTITNKTNTYRQIFVNGTQYGIEPGQSTTIKVPVGTVTTQLPGQPIQNWTLSPPNYQQGIDIVPANAATVTYYRAPTTTYYSGTTETVYYPSTTQTVYLPSTVQTVYYGSPVETVYFASPVETVYYPSTAETVYYPSVTSFYLPSITPLYYYYLWP